MNREEYEEIEWHEIHDDANEDLRNETVVKTIDTSDL